MSVRVNIPAHRPQNPGDEPGVMGLDDRGLGWLAPMGRAFVAFMTRGVRREIPLFSRRIMDLSVLALLALLLLEQG